MKTRTMLKLVFLIGTAFALPLQAAPKNDGRPDGGLLNYSEYGRTSTLDPVTSTIIPLLRLQVWPETRLSP